MGSGWVVGPSKISSGRCTHSCCRSRGRRGQGSKATQHTRSSKSSVPKSRVVSDAAALNETMRARVQGAQGSAQGGPSTDPLFAQFASQQERLALDQINRQASWRVVLEYGGSNAGNESGEGKTNYKTFVKVGQNPRAYCLPLRASGRPWSCCLL